MQRLHLFPSKVHIIREFWDLVPFMSYDELTEKYGCQYGCFSTKKWRFSIVWSRIGSIQT